MSATHRDVGLGMHVDTTAITPGTVIPFPTRDKKPTPTRCACGSAWFRIDAMFVGDRLVAYSASDAKCVVCGKECPC